MTSKAFQRTAYIIILTYILYQLHVEPIVSIVQNILIYWNIAIYTVTTLKENHPVIYIMLPFILVWLLLQKKHA